MENKYCYTKVILLGSGKLAYQCAKVCWNFTKNIEVLEYKVTDSTVLQKMCQKDDIRYACCCKDEMRKRLVEEKERTLVISAGNTFIIPAEVIGKKNLTIINWHNALLPRHKGRNAEAWSIYEGDTVTGITWHKISGEVDAGDIILQKEIAITEEMTALGLYKKQCDMGAQSLCEILELLLTDRCCFTKQIGSINEKMHYSRDIPNEGYLDLSWDYEKINRFLRAMDYGSLLLLGEMHVLWEKDCYHFHKYKIVEDSMEHDAVWQESDLIFWKEGHRIILKNLSKEQE